MPKNLSSVASLILCLGSSSAVAPGIIPKPTIAWPKPTQPRPCSFEEEAKVMIPTRRREHPASTINQYVVPPLGSRDSLLNMPQNQLSTARTHGYKTTCQGGKACSRQRWTSNIASAREAYLSGKPPKVAHSTSTSSWFTKLASPTTRRACSSFSR